MKIYLDSCAVQRPLDDIRQVRIALEAEALLGVFAQVESGDIDLVSSEVLELETGRNPSPIRRLHALHLLTYARDRIVLTRQIEERAGYFVSRRVKPLDALHLACAEMSGADYFCTCDDRLLRIAKSLRGLGTVAVSPLELVEELNL